MAEKKKPTIEDIVEETPIEAETPVEVVVEEPAEQASEEIANVEGFTRYIAKQGDSYPSLAASRCPEGCSVKDYARELFELNGGRVVRPGATIKLK